MVKFKKYGIYIGYFLLSLLVLGIIVSSIDYFTSINSTIVSFITMILTIILFFVIGYRSGKNSASKGYINGLKSGSKCLGILFLLSIIFNGFSISFTMVIYYLILLISSVIGSMIGINKKTSD